MSAPRIAGLVPVYDAGGDLALVLRALRRELGPGPRILVVDDGSGDGSRELAVRFAPELDLEVIDGPGRGLAAALNVGFTLLDEDLVAQVDHDVVLRPGWLEAVAARAADPEVAAVQGRYVAAADAFLPARLDCLELESRWDRLPGGESDHVATGNTLYRRAAVVGVGGFDEGLGYGAENDLGERLRVAGWRLIVDREARAEHRGRRDWSSWWRAQVGQGRGRLDLVARRPGRIRGDRVSGPGMMLRVPAALLALLALAARVVIGRPPARLGLGLLAALGLERSVVALGILRRRGDPTALALPAVHLLRDLAWVAAAVGWALDRLRGRPISPADSMPRRPDDPADRDRRTARR